MASNSLQHMLGERIELSRPFCGQGILSPPVHPENTPTKGQRPMTLGHSEALEGIPMLPLPLPRRKCPLCGEMKAVADFKTRTRKGKVTPQPYCYPCQLEYHRTWRQTKEAKQLLRAANLKSIKRYPDRRKAREAVAYALDSGRLEKGECEFAGRDCAGSVEAHHDDYSKPLEVRWVCRKHHRRLDRWRSGSLLQGSVGGI